MFDLSNYMKMNTYLDSQDPWFWPKLRWEIIYFVYKSSWLRYTLPHRRKVSGIGGKVFWSAQQQVYADFCFMNFDDYYFLKDQLDNVN